MKHRYRSGEFSGLLSWAAVFVLIFCGPITIFFLGLLSFFFLPLFLVFVIYHMIRHLILDMWGALVREL